MTAIACTDVVSTASPVSAPKKPRGRPAHTHDNRYVKAWLQHLNEDMKPIPDWANDIITGSLVWKNTLKDNTHMISFYTMLKVLARLDTLSTKAVEELSGLCRRSATNYVQNGTLASKFLAMRLRANGWEIPSDGTEEDSFEFMAVVFNDLCDHPAQDLGDLTDHL